MELSIERLRSHYAALLFLNVPEPREEIRLAFEAIARERFLPAGPWVFSGRGRSVTLADPHPHLAYSDHAVALDPQTGLNTGLPSLHALSLNASGVGAGHHVVQVGTGSGYFTAILAHIVGASGTVTGYELNQHLAQLARANLSSCENVSVVFDTGLRKLDDQVDLVYVCAGMTHVPGIWLDSLRPGGRIVFPLTPADSLGLIMVISKVSAVLYDASAIWLSAYYPCSGGRDETRSAALLMAVGDPKAWQVKSLRSDTPPDATCWYEQGRWWFSTRAATA